MVLNTKSWVFLKQNNQGLSRPFKNVYGSKKKPKKLKKQQFEDNIIKNKRNLFGLTKMTQNRVRVIRDIKTFLNNNKKIVTKQ